MQNTACRIIVALLVLLSSGCSGYKLVYEPVEVPTESVTGGGGPYFMRLTNGQSVTVTKLRVTEEGFEIHEVKRLSYHEPQRVDPYLIPFENVASITRYEVQSKRKSKSETFLDGLLSFVGGCNPLGP